MVASERWWHVDKAGFMTEKLLVDQSRLGIRAEEKFFIDTKKLITYVIVNPLIQLKLQTKPFVAEGNLLLAP